MAFFKISKGLEINLPTAKIDGRMYFCTDTGNIYIDYQDGDIIVRKLVDKSKFDELNNYIGSEISNLYTEINNINGTYIGPEPPEDINRLWVDTEDESQEGGYDTEILNSKIDNHNQDVNSHSDIRKVINSLPTKEYVLGVKNDLLNGAGEAYDTLKELGELIDDNTDAIDALEIVATGKADKTHYHTIVDISELQTVLDEKAIKTDFDAHNTDTVKHITSTERSNWNTAKTTADSAYALAESKVSSLSDLNITATADELNYVDGVTSNIQGQLDEKSHIATKYIDSATAYAKDVSADTAPYAKVLEIGGMTRKCANLIPPKNDIGTIRGLSFTNNADGSITVNGTATHNIYLNLADFYNLDGEYYISGCPAGGSIDAYRIIVDENNTGITYDIGEGARFTAKKGNVYSILISVLEGVTLRNAVFKPMLNRGTTALPYEPYFGGLRSAPVTEMESVGVNLADIRSCGNVIISNGVVTQITADANNSPFLKLQQVTPSDELVMDKWVSSLALGKIEFAFELFESVSRIAFGVNGSTRDTLIEFDVKDLPRGHYVFSCEFTNITQGSISWKDNQLNRGTTALPYTPYRRNTLPIPAEVQALDGYGWGVNADCYNYIDWEKKQFVKRVERVDLGTLNWTFNGVDIFYAGISDKSKGVSNFLSGKYPKANVEFGVMDDGTITGNASLGDIIYVKDSAYTDAATFKAAMSGVMLYYELAEPVITDISDLLPDNNLIGVEGNGTITLINEHRYDVPNKIEFYKGNNNILGANKFVGDLEGTATKATLDKNGNDIVNTYATKSSLEETKSSLEETNTTLSKKATGIKWTCPTTVNVYSRICKLDYYGTGLLTLTLDQSNQAVVYTYLIGTSYGYAFISQIGATNFPANNNQTVRVVAGSRATEFYVELVNRYAYSGSTVDVACSYVTLSNGQSCVPYDYYVPSSATGEQIRAECASKADGMVTEKIYGSLIGNADTATKATQDASGNTITSTYATKASLGRTTAVNAADENYTTYMARGTSLNSAKTSPAANGTIAWTYE